MGNVPSFNFVLLSGLFYRNQFRALSGDACMRNETKFCLTSLIFYRRRKRILAVFLNFGISVEQWLKLWWHVQLVKHLYASCSLRNQAELFVYDKLTQHLLGEFIITDEKIFPFEAAAFLFKYETKICVMLKYWLQVTWKCNGVNREKCESPQSGRLKRLTSHTEAPSRNLTSVQRYLLCTTFST